jgi:D-xylose 1-dehydrogenase (NADP+, D-xylono-1,5-lactone-forming)
VPVTAANPYRLELEDLSSAIRDGGPPRLGRDDAVGQARAIEALYAAADAARAVRV